MASNLGAHLDTISNSASRQISTSSPQAQIESMMCSPGVAMDVLLSARDMAESQRSFELRKVFAPEQSSSAGIETSFNDNLNNDGALDAYAETIIWRLRAVHAMVSLVDRGHQYFLAGAVRETHFEQEDDEDDVVTQQQWFGCDSVPTPGGLCENTLGLDPAAEEYPCFIINDLTKDPRFKDLPVVNGEVASYRFYAGTPITTSHGINIGSLFMFDNRVRDGLSRSQRKFLRQQASNIMKHLATKREAAERRRAALMSKGIAKFLDKTALFREYGIGDTSESVDDPTPSERIHLEQVMDGTETTTAPAIEDIEVRSSVLDRIRMTLDQAAEILRESLEITTGGVAFLDTSLANSEMELGDEIVRLIGNDPSAVIDEGNAIHIPDVSLRPPFSSEGKNGRHLSQGLIRSSADKHKPPKILAVSAVKEDVWDPTVPILNSKTLAALIKSYPKGNVWSIDGEGYYSSLEQIANWERDGIHSPADRKSSISLEDLTRQRFEAALLSSIFKKARQIVFLPLWDAGANKWYSGCFIWSQSAVPVFTVESELTYLSSFTNSMMVEISRLDAITANKMKSDFIGSISHEFRSPLHGILVSAEFLRDSLLDSSQSELVATIQNCSGTLLDTINHVLDYSKINTFEISSNQEGPVPSQLYQATNLALLCESVVEGMVAANSFRGNALDDVPLLSKSEVLSPRRHQEPQHNSNLEIILDIEERDWDYNVEPGAIQRVLMNLLGNAQKFTANGYIIIQLRILELEDEDGTKPLTTILSLTIKDSGKGMSTEFMERKLYRPFAQEDSFVPGVGLGLSIVWSIVNQLGGKIHVRSEQGKGTDIEVNLAVEKAKEPSHIQMQHGELIKIPQDAEQLVSKVRQRAVGKTVSFSRRNKICVPSHRELSWTCIERYLTSWFGFEVRDSEADIVITNQHDRVVYTANQRSLVVHEDAYYPGSRSSDGIASLCNPIGPFKLARCLLSLMDQEFPIDISASCEAATNTSDGSTQTPLGSPEERTILNGIIMTDYGFSPGTSVSSKDASTPQFSEDKNEPIGPFAPGPSISGMKLRLPDRKLNKVSASIPEILKSTITKRELSPRSIPLPPSPTRSTAPATPNRNPEPESRPLRILAVDDNSLNLQLLRRYLLKRKQDTIITATNGLEALNAVRKAQPKEKFDVVFMDISMPEMDGFESTRLIRSYERSQLHRSISDFHDGDLGLDGVLSVSPKSSPLDGFTLDVLESRRERRNRAFIVALTGLASRRDRDLAEQSGFDDFLTKPISFKRIGELLDRLSGGLSE